ncbi:hypothetical protein AWRI1631_45600 [Saccharomyces cerevisiae AWRI1631]|jgi:hypothetical protein|uniref:Uncharacterized protein n=1 Tax=Saccharomyces cerevisiae (strain AWRI1631) TaxID=545124 RepID=B5VGM5_YEAS6|nr:hypothetical protein AWRI1631_45600 [Saccharomyces cerevisiae AWRI1631]
MLVFPEVIILTAIIMTVQRPSGERNNSITMWDIGGPLKKSGDYIPREFLQKRRKVKVFFRLGVAYKYRRCFIFSMNIP